MSKAGAVKMVEAGFKIPETEEEAHDRILTLKEEKARIAIDLQVVDNPKREDATWAIRAQKAIAYKNKEIGLLSSWLRENFNEKKKGSGLLNGLKLLEHLKTHSKVVGHMHGVVAAAEHFVREESDEAFNALVKALEQLEDVDFTLERE